MEASGAEIQILGAALEALQEESQERIQLSWGPQGSQNGAREGLKWLPKKVKNGSQIGSKSYLRRGSPRKASSEPLGALVEPLGALTKQSWTLLERY